MKRSMPKYHAVYVNSKEFTVSKHFATEEKMDAWLAKHAVTIKKRGLYEPRVFG